MNLAHIKINTFLIKSVVANITFPMPKLFEASVGEVSNAQYLQSCGLAEWLARNHPEERFLYQ